MTTPYNRPRTLAAIGALALDCLVGGRAAQMRAGLDLPIPEERLAVARGMMDAAILVEIIHDPNCPEVTADGALHALAVASWLAAVASAEPARVAA